MRRRAFAATLAMLALAATVASTAAARPAASPLGLSILNVGDRLPNGVSLTLSARILNRGTGALQGSIVTLTVPAGVTLVDRDGGTVKKGVVTWSFGKLAGSLDRVASPVIKMTATPGKTVCFLWTGKAQSVVALKSKQCLRSL